MFSWSNNYIYFDYSCSDGRCRTSIGISISKDSYKRGDYDKADKRVMESIRSKVEEHIGLQKALKKPILKSNLQIIVDNVLGRKSKVPQTFKEDWEKMMEDMRSGDLLIKKSKKKYKPGTIDRYSDNLERIIQFTEDEGVPLKYDKIDNVWVDKLLAWATSKQNFSKNTIALLAAQLSAFLGRMHSKGKYDGTVHTNDSLSYGREKVDAVVTYDDEIIEIYNTTKGLSKSDIRARDIYCFGCCVGLRAEDLNRINDYHLVNDAWEFLTDKSGKKVLIPMHWLAREIYDKYNGKIPTYLSRSALGPHLPKICRAAGLTEKVLIVSTVSGVTKGTYYDKCDLVQPHTMRRSFATNAVLAGIPDNLVMEITGHGDWKTFKDYIKITQERKLKVLKEHSWFTGRPQIGLTGSDGK